MNKQLKSAIYASLAVWFIFALVLLAVFSTLDIMSYFMCFGLIVMASILTYEMSKNYD